MSTLTPAIDHVVILVDQALDAAAATYARLGFRLTERGHHSLGTSNNLAIFGPDYMELLGWEAGRLSERPAGWPFPIGLAGLVFRPPSCLDLPAELAARGVKSGPSRDFDRPVLLPEGERIARFRTTALDAAAVPYGRVYFCEHFTPELVWRAEWQRHANAAASVAEVVVAVPDPAAAIAPYAAMFGAAATGPVPGGMALHCAGGAAVLLLAEAAAGAHCGALPGPIGAGRMVGLTFRTPAMTTTAAALQAGGFAPQATGPHRLQLPPEACHGVALAFTDEPGDA